MTKPTPTELGDVEAAELYSKDFELLIPIEAPHWRNKDIDFAVEQSAKQAHLAGQQHGAQAERQRIWNELNKPNLEGVLYTLFSVALLKDIILGNEGEK